MRGCNKAKDRATWHVGACPQPSVVGFDNRPADRESKPQTARLRRVESFEHTVKSRRCESRSRISHLYRHAIRFVTGADEQLSLPFADAAHRLDGIDDQVEQYLLELDPISLHTRQAFS